MMFHEIKARKAKFGFSGPSLHLGTVVEMGEFITKLKYEFSNDRYLLEESGYHNPIVKFYTDDDFVAQWFRAYWKTEPLA